MASIRDAPFSLEVTQGPGPKPIEFLIDGDTQVEGKLQIGSQPTVDMVVAPVAGGKARRTLTMKEEEPIGSRTRSK